MMETSSSHSLLQYFEERDCEKEDKRSGWALRDRYGDREENMAGEFAHLRIKRAEPTKKCVEKSWGKHSLWNPEQKARVAKLEKQLKARWSLDELIEKQLNSFQAHYSSVMIPSRLNDMAQLFMPKGAPVQELASLTWFGDWRPSSIFNLLGSISASLSGSNGVEQVLPQLISEIRVEEAVIDEEMAEIQATCVVHLPFGPNRRTGDGSSLETVKVEFKKIQAVLTRAQNLRLKALELVAKKVLSQTDAAAFLIAFSAIQDSIHQFTTRYRLKSGSSSSSQPVEPAPGSLRVVKLLTKPRTKSCEGKIYSRLRQGRISKLSFLRIKSPQVSNYN